MTTVVLAIVMDILTSGKVVTIAQTPSERVAPLPPIPPGPPPLISFRYFEGKDRSRFGGLDLVLDDAGH
jgi:hypothetical protein